MQKSTTPAFTALLAAAALVVPCPAAACSINGGHAGLAGTRGSGNDDAVAERNTSGLPLSDEQAAYDVLYYDLSLRVDPDQKSIEGRLVMRARLLQALEALLLDLDSSLEVRAVELAGQAADWKREGGRIRIAGAERLAGVGTEVEVAVDYAGQPRVAPNPPWDGGFTWAQTSSGKPWIATSCQGEGADLWWPCKDQPSDEPDSMDLRITVPEPLVVASNGRLVSVTPAGRGWRTYHWHVSTPINNYGVALNIAPYVTIEKDYESVAGDVFPVTYWVLPENEKRGRELFAEMLEHLRFFEQVFGPYPFRADKYGVAETPHLGMEHQSIIAYGNEYKGNPWGKQRGFDFLLHHETSHEWWANLVTARDWNDFWIHEGFGTYAQALYVEKLHGWEAYLEQMASDARRIQNRGTVAPRESRSTKEMYFSSGRPDAPDADIYFKGSWILHTLRWLVEDEAFFRALRRMAYPDPALEKTTDGSACRFTSTDEILALAEEHTGHELDWFFEVYLRQPELPRLVAEVQGEELHLEWRVPGERPFPMPVPVRVGKELMRVELLDGKASVPLGRNRDYAVDPENRILKAQGK